VNLALNTVKYDSSAPWRPWCSSLFPKYFRLNIGKSTQIVECQSIRSKVVSIDESRFDWRQESDQSVSTVRTIYQICLKIFSLAVDKRMRNNQALGLSFYHHLLFYRNLCFDRTDVWFRSNELLIETTFERKRLQSCRWNDLDVE